MPNQNPGISQIKYIVAVGSGKGGVGKSSVSINLAHALGKLGYKVGLMDADIYGPSQPGMMGADPKSGIKLDGPNLFPQEKNGIKFISMGLLVPQGGPVIWRAPMAIKMIQQFLSNVVWGELDILLIDLPPGTGDVQLTLAQQASLSGTIIVTTPQEVSLNIAKKGLSMFMELNIPILGIVENMSGFTCSHCGEVTNVFKTGGGEKLANELKVPFLGSIPLDPEVMLSGDEGIPLIVKSQDSKAVLPFLNLAKNLFEGIDKLAREGKLIEPESIDVKSSGKLLIKWNDGHLGEHTPYTLRLSCKCASCVDENTNKKKIHINSVPLDITISRINKTGRYGLNIHFSDGHGTGIYKHTYLREICECADCMAKKGRSFNV